MHRGRDDRGAMGWNQAVADETYKQSIDKLRQGNKNEGLGETGKNRGDDTPS